MSMIIYPAINSLGLITQRPYTSGRGFSTIIQNNPFARPYSFAEIGGGLTNYPNVPLGRFQLNYPAITDAEFAVIRTFFKTSAVGALNQFTFIDPNGNLVTASENFAHASWTPAGVTVGGSTTDPFGGSLATVMTATISDASMSTIVIPAANLPVTGVEGFTLTASVWCKAVSANQELVIGFLDSASTLVAGQLWLLPQGVWRRISCPYVVATTGYIRMLIGSGGKWNSTVIDMFGAQCVALAGAGGYRKTPGAEAWRTQCRFSSDTLQYRLLEKNKVQVSLSIQESF